MANYKLVNHYWDTSGVYDTTEGKTQKVVNADVKTALNGKFPNPANVGASGQILRSDGYGGSVWDNAATQAEIGDAVTDWLDDNVPTGQTVVVDSSLTISGAAADAKVIGDKVTELSTAINHFHYSTITTTISNWESGFYNNRTGSKSTSPYWIRNIVLFELKKGSSVTLTSNGNYRANVILYSKSTASSSNYITGNILENGTYTYNITTDAFVGISIRYTAQTSPSTTEQITELINQITIKTPNSGGFDTVYVSTTGSDYNNGSYGLPFATVAEASKKSNNIVIMPGIYTEKITLSEKRQTLNISAYPSENRVQFDLSENLNCETVTDGVAYIPYTASQTDRMYTVFVGKTETLTVGSTAAQGKDYRCQLWSGDGKTQFIPVVDDIANLTTGQWTYDGTNIMVKGGTTGIYKLSARTTGQILSIANVQNLHIENIDFGYTYSAIADISNCANYEICGCSFTHSSTSNGINLGTSNGSIKKSKALYNCNDGFNFHDNGTSHIVDCEGAYSVAGDGISHHDYCSATIIGGYYHNCNKAGIADPTYGADVNIYNALCENNGAYGIQVALSTGGGINNGTNPIIVSGCAIIDNPVGISVDGYEVFLISAKFQGNTTDKTTSAGGTIKEI